VVKTEANKEAIAFYRAQQRMLVQAQEQAFVEQHVQGARATSHVH
jgi:hypothetical protein